MSDDLLSELITALRFLPGVGKKTAQRMALHLLERNREGGDRLGQLLQQSMSDIGHCHQCRNFTTQPVCELCQNPRRTNNQLCVVETPADLWAVEQAGSYSGRYFVLMGNLSPLDGIGPDDLGVDDLMARVKSIATELDEVILATNPTVEGDATAYYLADLLKIEGVKVSRIAHGIPVGGELEYTDSSTLAHALSDRKVFE